MKNYIKHICAGLSAVCVLTACDLDTTPTTALDTDGLFSNLDNAESVVRAAWYYAFNSGSTYQCIGLAALLINDDFAGSDVVRTTSYGFSASYQLTFGYGRSTTYNSTMWDITYTAINNCNSVLDNIDDIEVADESDESTRNRIKGQAYATRGYMYMLLASHYSFAIDKDPDAVCVPIYTQTTDVNTALTGNPASSVSEVYQQALDDLEMARQYIPEDYSHGSTAIDQYKPDYLVVLGLLARTNLYARNWQAAYDYACQALEQNSYLMTEEEYKSGFNDYSNGEWMWSLSCTVDDNTPCYNFHFKDCTTSGSYYTSFNVDPNFLENFEDGDYRRDLFAIGQNSYLAWTHLNYKFKFKDVDNMLGDILLMRSSEMYLIKAEAAAHLSGQETEAQQTLQTLRDARMKDGYTAAPVTATGDALLEEIWMERRKELWGEGFSLTDIIRNQQAIDRREWRGTYTDENGETHDIEGHTRTTFPDDSAFEPNSKYYLFRITEQEELQNVNLYSVYPKLDIYR